MAGEEPVMERPVLADAPSPRFDIAKWCADHVDVLCDQGKVQIQRSGVNMAELLLRPGVLPGAALGVVYDNMAAVALLIEQRSVSLRPPIHDNMAADAASRLVLRAASISAAA